jgi:8-oxo-dGTP diphosphatase
MKNMTEGFIKDERAFAVLATDVAILTVDGTDLKVLVTNAQSKSFRGMPTLPGGLVGYKETTKDAAIRIMKDVLTKTDFYIEQLSTFDDPKRDPLGRVVSVAYLVLIPWNIAKTVLKGDARWESSDSLPKLAYDHNNVAAAAVERLIGKLTYTNIVFGLMPEEFTLTEIQSVYENILGREIDKRNFRKKIGALKILKKLTKKRKGEANRPAQLYSFAEKKLKEIDIV